MRNILYALGFTVFLVVFGYLTKEMRRWWYYVLLFFSTWIVFWLTSGPVNAYEHVYTNRARIEIAWLLNQPYIALSAKTRAQYAANAEYHTNKAYEDYIAAKDKCWWLPDLRKRDLVRRGWLTLMAGIYPATPLYRVIASIIAMLTQYGVDCMDEWDAINDLLESAQYNSEMAKVYQDLLANG